MDISAAIDEYLGSKQNSITQKTYTWYAMFLNQFADWCAAQHLNDLSSITAPQVQQFVASGRTSNTNTRHHRAQVIKGFLNWCAVDDDFGVKEKTVRRIEMPKVEQSDVDIYSDAEIDHLFKACDKTRQPYRNRAILHLLLDTGIRASECCYDGRRPQEHTGVILENIVLGRGGESFLLVMGKGRKARTVGFGQDTERAIRRYLNRERGRSEWDFLFLSREGGPMSVRMLQQLLGTLGKLAGVQNCHAHRFRHTFAVNQLLNGTSSLVLMQLMGHSTLDSTKIYIRAMTHIQARRSATSVVDTMRHSKSSGQKDSLCQAFFGAIWNGRKTR
jgi:integrase/recombinase XerD